MEQLYIAPHIGMVKELVGTDAVIQFQRSKMCDHCGACMSVGDKEVVQRIQNTLGAKVGDYVEVYIPPKRIVQASMLAYVVPLLMLLLGVWVGSRISDIMALILGLFGCGIAYLVLRLLEQRRKLAEPFRPHMVDILDSAEDVVRVMTDEDLNGNA